MWPQDHCKASRVAIAIRGLHVKMNLRPRFWRCGREGVRSVVVLAAARELDVGEVEAADEGLLRRRVAVAGPARERRVRCGREHRPARGIEIVAGLAVRAATVVLPVLGGPELDPRRDLRSVRGKRNSGKRVCRRPGCTTVSASARLFFCTWDRRKQHGAMGDWQAALHHCVNRIVRLFAWGTRGGNMAHCDWQTLPVHVCRYCSIVRSSPPAAGSRSD